MNIDALRDNLTQIGLFTYQPQEGDEQNFVDRQVIMGVLLPWLGWGDEDYDYNVQVSGSRPDFLVKVGERIVFFIESKATSKNLRSYDDQIVTYLRKFASRGILCNGIEILAVEGHESGYKVLYHVNLKELKQGLFRELLEAELKAFYRDFSKERWTSLSHRIDFLSVDEETFLSRALPIGSREETFIGEALSVVNEMRLDVYWRVHKALEVVKELEDKKEEFTKDLEQKLRALESARKSFLFKSQEEEGKFSEFIEQCGLLIKRLGSFNLEVRPLQAKVFSGLENGLKNSFENALKNYHEELISFQLMNADFLAIAESYYLWRERWQEVVNFTEEGNDPVVEYSGQVAYTFFVKVFLLRVLEDKGIINRILSDGGFKLWREFTQRLSLLGSDGSLRLDFLTKLAIKHVKDNVLFDVEKNLLYDWYVPSDLILLSLLEVLCKYNFKEVRQDVIGFVYERLLTQSHRHNLGVYLTPSELVEHVLEVSGFSGTQVIGAKVLDPACGSGGFLVHAVRRYRKVLEQAGLYGEELARKFLQDVQENFYGIDINAFSVYLAGINLFIQVLDDFKLLVKKGQIKKPLSFKLFTENTLRYAQKLMKEKFNFVFANPPYVSAKRADTSLHQEGRELLEKLIRQSYGDVNAYVLFLALSGYLLEKNGVLGFVVPLTLLGDAQTESLRRWFDQEGSVLHITKLVKSPFKDVSQAVVVFVWEKSKGASQVSVAFDLNSRVYVRTVSYFDQKRKKGSAKGFLYWIVPKKELICKLLADTHYYPTLGEYLSSIGAVVRQGDINTSEVSAYAVSEENPLAMPVYKGEDLRPFRGLADSPAGIKGIRYVAFKPNESSATNKRLQEVYARREAEHLVLYNEIAGFDLPRAIKAVALKREREVFTHTLWVVSVPSEKEAKRIASLLTSLIFNAFYNLLSTNTHTVKELLLSLRVPPDLNRLELEDLYDRLSAISTSFKERFGVEDLTEGLDLLWYRLKEGEEFLSLASWDSLIKDEPLTSLENFLYQYGQKVKTQRGEKLSAYLKAYRFKTPQAEKVASLFLEKFGSQNYSSVNHLPLLPKYPGSFLVKLENLQREFNSLLSDWVSTLRELDLAVIKAYGFSFEPEEVV